MGCAVRYILCSVAGLVLAIVCYCQNVPVTTDGRDTKLDRYEFLCAKCMDMKLLVSSGENVERESAAKLINEFLSVNKEIKSDVESMTEAQKARFERINIWFSTGRRPVALDDSLSLERIDNAEVLMSGLPLPENDFFCIKKCKIPAQNSGDSGFQFCGVKSAKPRIRTTLMLTCSFPLSYGLRVSLSSYKWGGYVSGNCNFIFEEGDYTCGSDGKLDNGMSFWGSGNHKLTMFAAFTGVVYRPLDWLDVYAGAGYGNRHVLWQDIEGRWATVKDMTYRGAAVEAGVIFSWKRLSVSLGVSTLEFKTAGAEMGIGVNF